MGREARAKKMHRDHKRKFRWRWLKFGLGLFLGIVLIPIAFAAICYRENEWPWETALERD